MKKINTEFFDTWTEESAYILGFIYADGCLSLSLKGYWSVTLSSNDKEILEQIRTAMDSEHTISLNNSCWRLVISNKKISEKLLELGVTPNKSLTITFPHCVPAEYLPHFIRGYFDGNGHFTYELHRNGKRRMISGFTTGSEDFVNGLAHTLKNLGLSSANVMYRDRRDEIDGNGNARGRYYAIRYYVHDTESLYNIMYKDSTIYMKRKKGYYDAIKTP